MIIPVPNFISDVQSLNTSIQSIVVSLTDGTILIIKISDETYEIL